MGVREFFGLSVREDVPGPSDPSTALAIPRRSEALRSVTAADAFSLSMVYRAVQIHATSIKQLSLDTKRAGVVIPNEALIRRPDIDQSRSAFFEQTVVSLACSGNGYWRIYRDDLGKVSNLKPLNPLDMRVNTSRAGNVTGYVYQGNDLAIEDVKHLKLLRVPGTPYGLGPVQAAQKELRGALDLRDYSSNWFEESGIPNGVLKTEQVLAPDQAQAAKDSWNSSQGAKQGVAVLGNGISYAPVYLNPKDAQFLESQQFTVTQIARLFGVPSSLMLATVEGSTDTYQNVSQDWLGYVRFSLMAYLIEIEDAFTDLLPRGQEATFNVEALLRSDTATRYTAHKTALEAGFMTVDEVRAIENLPPLTATAQTIPQPTPIKEPAA